MTKQLLSKIEGCYSSMSKGHKRITDYITENYDKAAFMTAAKLGDAVGVSESTVVRFAFELGFSGYPQLQKTLQQPVKGVGLRILLKYPVSASAHQPSHSENLSVQSGFYSLPNLLLR